MNRREGETQKYLMKWLFITTEFPWPLNHGTWLRVYHLAKTLRGRGESVSVLSYQGDLVGNQAYTQIGVGVVAGPQGIAPRRGESRCFLGPYVYDRQLGSHIAAHAGGFDVAILVRPNMLQYSQEASAAGLVLADMVDDPVLEEGRGFRGGPRLRRWLRQTRFFLGEYHYEQKFLRHVNCAVFVSEEDARSFSRRHLSRRTVAIPNGVDLSYFARPSESLTYGNGHSTVTFLGNLAHPPNRDAALFLIREIAPLVWKREPETRFLVVGSNPGPDLMGLAGPLVSVTGWVEDVRPLLWSSTAVLLPMRTGTGIKNKLLESWAANVGVVATPLACQGVPARDEENLLVGQTPGELAEKTLRLLEDPGLRRRVADAGHATVREHLTWSMAGEQLTQLVLSLKGTQS